MTVAEREQENLKDGNIKPSEEGFTKTMPVGFDSDSILDLDDVIEFPTVLPKVYKREFGKDAQGKPIFGEFIVINVKHEGKADRAINFYPTSFSKNIWPAKKNEAGEVELDAPNGPLNPKGTAIDLYLSFKGKSENGKTDVQLGMEAMLGKKVKISQKQEINTQVYRNGKRENALRKTNLLTFDLA